jgi:predicted MPP superfamily phosphohydrolase
LPGWPDSHDGYRIGLIADSHVRDSHTVDLTQRALDFLTSEKPDMIVFAGDMVEKWNRRSIEKVYEALLPLQGYEGPVLAVPGNHDYYGPGDPDLLRPLYQHFGIELLRNDCWHHDGINWVGIDSACAGMADPYWAVRQADPVHPTVVVWHEPDAVQWLPRGPDLMLSGHSHGGQFTTPWGWAPMTSRLGKKYLRGYYPDAPVPIYVSRGLGTTGPPSRLFCRAEATILTLRRGR